MPRECYSRLCTLTATWKLASVLSDHITHTSYDHCVFIYISTGLFIGFELPSYTFQEPEIFQNIMEFALVTSRVPEEQVIVEIALLQGSATKDVGEGGDYEFAVRLVVFDAGVTRQIVRFALNPDLIAEGTESFEIRAMASEYGPDYDCVSPCIPVTTIFILDDNDRKHSTFIDANNCITSLRVTH